MANAEITRGPADASGTQLPMGAASTLNEAAANAPAPPETAATPQAPAPVQAATPADYQPQYQPDNSEDAFITGPTVRPNEPVTQGARPSTAPQISPELRRSLPLLNDAANLPGAPAQMRFLVKYLLDQVS